MRHFLVWTLAALITVGSTVAVRADNQTSAERIADLLSEQFPDDEITIQYLDGKVWLRGEVGSTVGMHKVVRFVSKIEGVQIVENEMTLVKVQSPISPVSANLPRILLEEDEEVVFIAPSLPMDQFVRTAPTPGSITTAVVVEGRQDATITQAGVRHQARKLNRPGGAREYVVSSDAPEAFAVASALPAGAQPQGYATRGPQDFVAEHGQHGGAYCTGTHPNLPKYAWPSYAAHPNYSQVTYPKRFQHKAWPNIGPFYPYPKAPLGWRKVTMEWHDGDWWLDFDDGSAKGPFSPLFRQPSRYTY